MHTINVRFLETIKKAAGHSAHAFQNAPLIRESKKVFINSYNFSKRLSIHELASILTSLNSWQNSKSQVSQSNFNTRDIVVVDLGLGHGYEMSYKHPCIVLHNSLQGFCLVVPCSTGKYGKNNKYILDGEATDGFARPTGVLLDAMRTVSKVRIEGKVGEINVSFLDKLNKKLTMLYFPHQDHQLATTIKDLEKSKEEYSQLQQKLLELEQKK